MIGRAPVSGGAGTNNESGRSMRNLPTGVPMTIQDRADRYTNSVIEAARALTGSDVRPETIRQIAELAERAGVDVHTLFPVRT